MVRMNKTEKESKKKEFYWLTLITIPTILMAIVSIWITDTITRTLTQSILFFFQAVVVKGILENN